MTCISPIFAVTWLDRLLGLSRLSVRQSHVELGWVWPLPAWAWAMIILSAAALAAWSYWRLWGPTPGRSILATVRALLVLLIVALIAGPQLVLPQERVESDYLVLLVDRSASMGIRDMEAGRSRDQALQQALTAHAADLSPEKLGPDRHVLWLGFDQRAYPIEAPTSPAHALPPAEGSATALRTAIQQSLQRVAGRPVAGIVLLTDGRSPQATGAELVHQLQQQGVSVFAVPLGAAEGTGLDLAIARLDAPPQAYIKDAVPVTVWIDRYPADAPIDPAQVRVRLVDAATGAILDQQPARASLDQPVRLSARSAVAGLVQWRVELEYVGSSATQPGAPALRELVAENNQRTLAIEFVDRPVRVLYVEGYPRWEYRYLKNMLVRENSIDSSVLLLSADQTFVQEGDQPIARLPRDPQELSPYDVIIIGDVPADYFAPDQLELIRDHVAARGAGLLWIGGSRHTPQSYEATPLADLLPMRRPGAVEPMDLARGPVAMTPTLLADMLSVLRIQPAQRQTGPAPHADSSASWWPVDLPGLYWAQNLGPLKPTAEVLATVGETGSTQDGSGKYIPSPSSSSGGGGGGQEHALVARLRYGSGQSLYVATDEIWRWRRGLGDVYFDQYWIQLLRLLARGRLGPQDRRLWLEVSHRRVEVDQPIVVRLRMEEAQMLSRDLPRVAVTVHRAAADSSTSVAVVDRLELLPQTPADAAPAGRRSAMPASREYQAIWRPTLAGAMTLRVAEPALADLHLTQDVEVLGPGDEMRQIAADHARLAALAQQTRGQVVSLDRLGELPALVPDRARRTPTDIREPLWHSPLALGLLVLLLTAEWLGRKIVRLV